MLGFVIVERTVILVERIDDVLPLNIYLFGQFGKVFLALRFLSDLLSGSLFLYWGQLTPVLQKGLVKLIYIHGYFL